jgi:hypothetical protein
MMNGIIKTDRRYTLGEYKYTTMEDVIGDVPGSLMINPEFTSAVRYLQLVGFEIAYRKYIKLASTVPPNMDMDKALEQLEKIREDELKKLKVIMNGVAIEEIASQTPPLKKGNIKK